MMALQITSILRDRYAMTSSIAIMRASIHVASGTEKRKRLVSTALDLVYIMSIQ